MPLIYRFIIIAIMTWGLLTAGAYVYKPALKPQEASKACASQEKRRIRRRLPKYSHQAEWIPFIIIDTYQGEER